MANAVAAKTIMVKAVPVNGLCQFVATELNHEQLRKVLSNFPPEEAKFLTGHVLATDQVPLELVNRFTELAAKEKGEPLKSFGKRAGRFGAELGLKTVYKFIMMVMSVESVLKKAPFMWTRVYDGGTLNVTSGANKARITLTDFPSHEACCARISGWFSLIGERAGAKDLTLSHTQCMAAGGKECAWDFTWK